MPEYGLTPDGPNLKRMDVILDDMHDKLSEKWGVNTRANPMSFLNVHLTDLADKLAQLWELGGDIYYAMYPSSASGIHLDHAAQYGGTVREMPARSHYPIHCTGTDGTVIPAGTTIASDTNPAVSLVQLSDKVITRQAFNRATVKVASLQPDTVYTVSILGELYSHTSGGEPTELEVLEGLAAQISGFRASVDAEKALLSIQAPDDTGSHILILTPNLTTETVTSILTFATEEYGDIVLPKGSITRIVKGVPGFRSCVNLSGYIAGRLLQTDAELRGSYADKIFNRSSRMLESIKSAILMNVQGVKSLAPYENPTHAFDEFGRYPHSIEIVVEGGDSAAIAEQIFNEKAGGINTFGDEAVHLPGEYGEDITVRFNRPTPVYVWFRVSLLLSRTEALPPNYADLIKDVVVGHMDGLSPGADVIPQRAITTGIHAAVSGVEHADIYLFATRDEAVTPDAFPLRTVDVTPREKARTDATMVEVVLDG